MEDRKLLRATEKKVMLFIQEFMKNNVYCPSIREIGEGCGLKSSSSVFYVLEKLQEKGYLKRMPLKFRAFKVLKEVDKYEVI